MPAVSGCKMSNALVVLSSMLKGGDLQMHLLKAEAAFSVKVKKITTLPLIHTVHMAQCFSSGGEALYCSALVPGLSASG